MLDLDNPDVNSLRKHGALELHLVLAAVSCGCGQASHLLWPAAELRFAAIVCSTLCVVVAARGQHLSSCLPLAHLALAGVGAAAPSLLGPRLPAAAVALMGPSLAPRLPAPAPGSAAAAPRLRAVPAPVLARAP